MVTHARPERGIRPWAALALALFVVALGLVADTGQTAYAHTPHDNITDVITSPQYSEDGKVWAISGNRLMVSTDEGRSWKPLVRSLPSPPQDGKTLANLAIAASDPRVMYVSSTVGGVFRSQDGGSSWHPAAGSLANTDIAPIAVAPRSSDAVLAAGALSGLYRTTDGGRRWQTIAGFERVRVLALAFVPRTGRAVAGDASGRVWTSDDNGVSWRVAARSPDGAITALATSGRTAEARVFAGTLRGALLRSDDSGGTFTAIGTGLPKDTIFSIAISPTYAKDRTLWMSAGATGVYRSTDAGETWTRAARGLTTNEQAQEINIPNFRTLVVARNSSGARVLYEGGYDGMFRSDNDGRNWTEVQTLVDYITGLDVSPNFANDSTVAISTYVKGAYLSTDAGEAWQTIDTGLEVPGALNSFAPVHRLHNIVFSPDFAEDRTIFSATWTGFLRSSDGGSSWTSVEVAPPTPEQVLRQFVIAVSPHFSEDQTLFLGTRQGDVFRSDRGGKSGSWVKAGNTGAFVHSLVLGASSPDEYVLYAGTVDGVLTSPDRGATWTRIGPAGDAKVAISPDYVRDDTVFAGTDAGLFVTRDAGRTWTELTVPRLSSATGVRALAVSPDFGHDQTVLVSVGGTGLYRSTDGGASFTEIGSELTKSNHIIEDFSNPTGTPIQFSPAFARDRTIFGYAGHDVVRSTDGGDSWRVLQVPTAATFLRSVRQGNGEDHSMGDGTDRRRVILLVVLLVLVVVLVGVGVYLRRRRPAVS